MRLNEYGEIVRDEWLKTPAMRPNVELGEWVVMPNHIHGIVVINHTMAHVRRGVLRYAPTVDASTTTDMPKLQSPSQTIGAIVRGFKSAAAKRINTQRGTPGLPVWQHNYWEHVIRNEQSYIEIATYIVDNPAKWEIDKLYVGAYCNTPLPQYTSTA